MNIDAILLKLSEYAPAITLIVLLCSIFLEVSKVKLHPWRWILQAVGRRMNADVIRKIDDMGEGQRENTRRINEMEASFKATRRQNLRRSILRFADEVRLKDRHSKEMFDTVMADIDEYERLCRETGDPNSVVNEAVTVIRDVYHKQLLDNDFL